VAYRFRRGRGQFVAPTSRSGVSYTHAGRRVLIREKNFSLEWNGPALADMIMGALFSAFTEISDVALDYMQSIVPVKTGALRDSCFVDIGQSSNGRLSISIGATMPYAVYIELGTMYRDATPYIRPTYDFVVKVLPGVIRSEVANRSGRRTR
jgi:HK97 gp10 family phage protein